MAKGASKQRILHVDDEKDALCVVKTILEKEGFEVVSVNSGKDALRKIMLEKFDLVILDIMMPDTTGWAIFSKIGKMRKKYKVIFLSVLDLPKDKLQELKKAGVVDYISKPFDHDDLVERIKKAISGR